MNITLKSKYKIWGGLALLIFLNILWMFFTWQVLAKATEWLTSGIYIWKGFDFAVITFVLFLQTLFIGLLINNCRFIIIDDEKIKFINPICPFVQKTKYWNDFDYMVTVMEYSRVGSYEAIWIIRNHHLSYRISSFYYSNYNELKQNIQVKNEGELKIGPFKQLFCLLGAKI